MNEDQIELRPPSAQQVARRALCLCALVCRGYTDNGAGDPHSEQLRERILEWLSRNELQAHLEPWEADLISAELGQSPQDCVYKATWAVEGLSVLAWALGRFDFPAHDQQVDPYAVTDSLYFLADDAKDVIATARLRGGEELVASRELMYAIHCRLRGYLRNKTAGDISHWMEQDWLEALGVDRARLIVDGDLAIGGKPISAVGAENVQKCEWAVCQQHRASIWLVGEEFPSYWGWTVDT